MKMTVCDVCRAGGKLVEGDSRFGFKNSEARLDLCKAHLPEAKLKAKEGKDKFWSWILSLYGAAEVSANEGTKM